MRSSSPSQSAEAATRAVPTPYFASVESGDALASAIAMLKVDGGARLLQHYKKGVSPAATFNEKYLANRIGGFCTGYVNPPVLQHRQAGRHESVAEGDGKLAIMKERIDIMARRCTPLAEIGEAAWRSHNRRLARELAGPNSPFAHERLTSEEGQPLSEEELEEVRRRVREALDAYGPVTLEWKGSTLLELAKLNKNTGGIAWPENEDVAGIATSIAACYSGQPCGPDSLAALGICVGTGGRDCGEDLVQSALLVLPNAADRKKAVEFARELAAAIQSRNWQALGLELVPAARRQ